jgi:hypothetical protein
MPEQPRLITTDRGRMIRGLRAPAKVHRRGLLAPCLRSSSRSLCVGTGRRIECRVKTSSSPVGVRPSSRRSPSPRASPSPQRQSPPASPSPASRCPATSSPPRPPPPVVARSRHALDVITGALLAHGVEGDAAGDRGRRVSNVIRCEARRDEGSLSSTRGEAEAEAPRRRGARREEATAVAGS